MTFQNIVHCREIVEVRLHDCVRGFYILQIYIIESLVEPCPYSKNYTTTVTVDLRGQTDRTKIFKIR